MAYRGFGSKVVVDCDVPLDKEVCKDCGVCIEYCPTSALMWPEGVKKREGWKRPAPSASVADNGGRSPAPRAPAIPPTDRGPGLETGDDRLAKDLASP